MQACIETARRLPHRMCMTGDTRNRILVASLLLFNEQGEPHTSTNEIADEVDISPGNLHYHFRRKAQLIEALLDEFQADAQRVLQPPDSKEVSIDDFWLFLHLLLECTAAYRFLFRDLESLTEQYPRVDRVMRHFAKGLAASFRLWLHQLVQGGWLRMDERDVQSVGRNLAVIALFSERFDSLAGAGRSADDAALRVAASVLIALRPFTTAGADAHFASLAAHYTD